MAHHQAIEDSTSTLGINLNGIIKETNILITRDHNNTSLTMGPCIIVHPILIVWGPLLQHRTVSSCPIPPTDIPPILASLSGGDRTQPSLCSLGHLRCVYKAANTVCLMFIIKINDYCSVGGNSLVKSLGYQHSCVPILVLW